MQNKGFVVFISVVLAVVCLYYLSFTPVVNHYEKKAETITLNGGDGRAYLDSMANEKVWFGYTLKKARTQQMGLGLDLKGGMNVILRINARDLVYNLSGKYEDPIFKQALDNAVKSTSSGNYIDKFISEYKRLQPDGKLAAIFGGGPLREEISARATDQEVEKILKEKFNSASEATINVLRTRIDKFGVVSPNIQRIEGEGRILVELPGVKEPERVRALLQKSANLQFRRTYTLQEVEGDLRNANEKLALLSNDVFDSKKETEIDADNTTSASEKEVAKIEQQTEKTDSISTEDSTTSQETSNGQAIQLFDLLKLQNRGGAVVGIARSTHIPTIDSMLEVAHKKGYLREDLLLLWGNSPIINPQTNKETDYYELYAIHNTRTGEPDMSGDVVTGSRSEVNDRGIGRRGPVVTMSMNEEGARQWARLTRENIGRAIAIVLDNTVYSAPNVNNEITGGNSEISGNFTIEQTVDLANVLNSGKMDASVVIEQENVIGPTLGKDSIRAGVISFAIAIVLLMAYMFLFYGFIPGILVNGALLINSFFTLGILTSFHSVLTLSGIAGLVLTLGMAVDANVLIFERIKEELRAGKPMTRAIKDGYSNAFSAIFDSNITTIITGLVLYAFGTGPIRGFATTLIIGLIASFLTAVFLTRIVAEWLDKKGKMDKVTYTTFFSKNFLRNTQINFLGGRKIGLAIPLVIIALGAVSLGLWGFNRGIEFSGGRNYIIKFDKPVSVEQVRSALSEPLHQKLVLTTIGSDGTEIRIATNYQVEDNSKEMEDQMNTILYENTKDLFEHMPDRKTFLEKSIISSQKVSASMSHDIRNKAIIAVSISLIMMALYILLRFRYIHYSIGAFASVVATTACIISLYALLWKVMPFTMELDQNFIAAVLALIGYSINDVVIVFDRIRENHKLYPNRDLRTTINESLNSTLVRTINTSFTTLLVMLIIFIFGGASMRSFTFAILLGIIIGTYSTLFVATPIAYIIAQRSLRKKANKGNTRAYNAISRK